MKEHQSATIGLFKDLRGDNPLPPGKLLDAGSGKDTIAGVLRAMGFAVVSLDLYDTPKSSGGDYHLRRFIRADLNAPLPFADAVFDYVLCSESLQYLDNHALVFKEFARVLTKGGHLIISIPNVLCASSRVYFLRRGYYPSFKPVRTVDASKGWDAAVYNPISLVEIYAYGRRFGLEIKKVAASRFKAKNLICFMYFLRLKADYALGLLFERGERKKELLKLLSSNAALLGDHLIVLMEKKTGGGR
ncbi:MAG: class I SAM-dependent methyltransferase [Deltaproteobacteria bacterium]|nr:class I SAM-dependent methyltransferase [Deltaproteobacteria bacterium]